MKLDSIFDLNEDAITERGNINIKKDFNTYDNYAVNKIKEIKNSNSDDISNAARIIIN